MSDEPLLEQLHAALPRLAGLGAIVGFDLGQDGTWLVDARGDEPSLTATDATGEAASVIVISASNLIKLLNGTLDPMVAYGLGRLKVQGSRGVAMKLVSALG